MLERIQRLTMGLGTSRPVLAVLAALKAIAAVAAVRAGQALQRVEIRLSRPLNSAFPPWTYDPDMTRFFGTVVEGLCPMPAGAEGAPALRAVAAKCEVVGDGSTEGVRATFRRGLRRNDDGALVNAGEIAARLAAYKARLCAAPCAVNDLWADIAVDTGAGSDPGRASLLLRPATGVSAVVLLSRLRSVPVAFWPEQANSSDPQAVKQLAGTGPFKVEAVDGTGIRLRRVEVQGGSNVNLIAFTPERTGDSQGPVTLGRLDAIVRTLKVVDDSDPDALAITEDAYAVIAAVRSEYDSGRRARIAEALRRRSCKPTLFQGPHGHYRPAFQAFPEGNGVFDVYPCPAVGEEGDLSAAILTHTGWQAFAESLVQAEQADGAAFRVHAYELPVEDRERMDGRWEISLLALGTRTGDPPILGFLDGLLDMGWLRRNEPAARELRRIAEAEARGDAASDIHSGIGAWLAAQRDHFVPIARVSATSLLSRRLRGIHDGQVDPARLYVEPEIPEWLPWVLWCTFVVTVVMIGAVTLNQRRVERGRRTLVHRFRQLYHDLAAPLAQIMAQTEEGRDTDTRDGVIFYEAEAASSLVENIRLTIERDNRLDIRPGPRVPLGGLLEHEVRALRFRALAEELSDPRITLDAEPAARELVIPSAYLRGIVRNLCSNAYRYRGEGPLDIQIRASLAGTALHLEVADRGLGFPPDRARALLRMDAFQASRRASAGEGLGLGLTIVQALVQRLEGRLTLKQSSNPTTFVVNLPLKALSESTDASHPVR